MFFRELEVTEDQEMRIAMEEPGYILLAEEDPYYASIVELALREAGVDCPVHVVRSNDEVVRSADGDLPAYPPRLILLGLRLQFLNDFKALRAIRRRRRLAKVPVVILSGVDFEHEEEMARALGADHYGVKPGGFADLVHIAENIKIRWLEPTDRAAAA